MAATQTPGGVDLLRGRTVVVAGGTGNVGTHIVGGLLEHGATVAVPSRSEEKVRSMRDYLAARSGPPALDRLATFVGDVANEAEADTVARSIVAAVGTPNAVVATLGGFVPAPSLLTADPENLRTALEHYAVAHFSVARTFLPRLRADGGRYVFVNGPLAFGPWKGSGAGLVSIATAAQQMLFRVLAQELEETPVEVLELVTHAFVRERETQPGSPLPAEAVGRYVAYLLSDASPNLHGQSVHLRSMDLLAEAGIEVSGRAHEGAAR